MRDETLSWEVEDLVDDQEVPDLLKGPANKQVPLNSSLNCSYL